MLRSLLIHKVSRTLLLINNNTSRQFQGLSSLNYQQNQDDDIVDLDEIRDPCRKTTLAGKTAVLKSVQKKFMHCFDVSESEALKVLNKNKELYKIPLKDVVKNIELLLEKNIIAKNILDNPWLLTVPSKYLNDKIKLIEKLKPRNLNDFIPLVRVSALVLMRTEKTIAKEAKYVPEGNRIYYFCNKLDLEPALVSRYFSTHMFMFEVTWEMLVENLDIMLEYEITSMSIIRDLWAFKYYPNSIINRLERCKNADKDNLKPWMIRCTEEVLQRSLFLSNESKNLLGESTVNDYLSERLGFNHDTIEDTLTRNQSVRTTRIKKIKEILDYLLIEEKFLPIEVLSNLRILCHSLDTTRKRLDELKSHGCRPTSLVIVCKSQNEYNKFLDNWIEVRNRKEQHLKNIKS